MSTLGSKTKGFHLLIQEYISVGQFLKNSVKCAEPLMTLKDRVVKFIQFFPWLPNAENMISSKNGINLLGGRHFARYI